MAKMSASHIMISNLMKLQDVFNLIVEKKVGTFSGSGIIFFDGKHVLLLKKKNGRWVFLAGEAGATEPFHLEEWPRKYAVPLELFK